MIAWMVNCQCGKKHTLLRMQRIACECGKIHDQATQIEYEYTEPRVIKLIKRFAIESDRGVGDTVERLIQQAGGRPLIRLKATLESIGVDCGCTDRRDWLNETWPYK